MGVNQAPIPNINPAQNVQGSVFDPLLNQSLLTLNPDGSIGPGLATKWGYVGTGNKTFDLTLRQDVKFSDGEVLNAVAVKAWLDYFAATPGPNQGDMAVASVQTKGEWEVRINLAQPNPYVPYLLATWVTAWGNVASPKAVANPTKLTTDPAGAGPYKIDLANTVVGNKYTLVPNPYYFDKSQVHFKTITIKVIPNQSSLLQAAQAGQVDVVSLTGNPSTVTAAKKAGMSVVSAPAYINGIFFGDLAGGRNPALGDVRVRQALNYALDRAAINKAVNGDNGTPTSVFTTLDGVDSKYENVYSYDPNKARALLKEAGHGNGLKLSTDCNQNNAVECQAIAQQLKAVGVDLQIKTPAPGADVVMLQSGEADTFTASWNILYTWFDYPYFWGKKATFKATASTWSDPKIETWFQQASVQSEERAAPLMRSLIGHTVDQALFVPVFNQNIVYYYNPKTLKAFELKGAFGFQAPFALGWAPA